jgi:hypothetical protein
MERLKTRDRLGKRSPGFDADLELVLWDVRVGVQKSRVPGCLSDKILYGGA